MMTPQMKEIVTVREDSGAIAESMVTYRNGLGAWRRQERLADDGVWDDRAASHRRRPYLAGKPAVSPR